MTDDIIKELSRGHFDKWLLENQGRADREASWKALKAEAERPQSVEMEADVMLRGSDVILKHELDLKPFIGKRVRVKVECVGE